METRNTPLEIRTHTGFRERASYGLYFVGQNIFYFLIMQFLMLFYTDYRFMSPAAVGLIFLVARVWDAVNDPMFGIIVDKAHLKRGKFKPWIAAATCLVPLATIAIFAMPEGMGATGQIAYASVTYILFGMLYTVCDVPIFALATAMTDNIQERTTIISIGRLAAMFAMLVLSITVMPIVLAAGWLQAAVALSVIGFAVMLPINIFAKERFVDKNAPAVSLKDIFRYLAGNKYLLIFYLSMIVSGCTNTVGAMINYVAKYMLGGENMIPVNMLAMTVPVLIIAATLPAITKRIDKFHIYIAGTIINIGGALLGYFVGYGNLAPYPVIAAFRGIGFGVSNVMAFMFAADCVEYGDFKTGKRAEGITFSIQTFATKITGAVSGAICGIPMTAVGYDGALGVQGAATIDGMWKTYTLFPVIGFALSLPLLWLYKLRDKDVQIMALCNQKQITREEAVSRLSRTY
ncbi:MAG: MFS transporter [Spirochaetaceae bacterium]|jgi:sugar (glycoside-pentoside-hexuronide) transporter|nr:MFS transporter [Spirochaetaceae bacterium]